MSTLCLFLLYAFLYYSRKTILFWQNKTWDKKESDENFDIPMECYDGPEICKLVGIYI